MTILKNKEEIRKIRNAGRIIREIFLAIKPLIKEGISTADLDGIVERLILEKGGRPAFKGYRGFPASICASVNDVVVHGIPSEDTVLSDGDIISVDVGVEKDGYFADAARTFPVGRVDGEAARLIEVTERCLSEAIVKAKAGGRLSDISHVVETIAADEGFKEVRAFVGHGIGKELHESPEVPNWGAPGKGPVLKEGLVLAIEPMINGGTRDIEIRSDGWTAVTKDGRLSAHFEDTVIIGKEKAEIIT
ncbi:MAG: type I methionyl aminopeptidase [Candidatus Omnitrophota bacterium]|nr:type I methionyl aminopeptidase [Candidatus Omnitrophota bacterium]